MIFNSKVNCFLQTTWIFIKQLIFEIDLTLDKENLELKCVWEDIFHIIQEEPKGKETTEEIQTEEFRLETESIDLDMEEDISECKI